MAKFECTLGSDGRTGLLNPEYWCYMNTFMQCMGHTDPLRQFILSTAKLDVFNFKGKGTENMAEKKKLLAVCGLGYTFHVLVRQMWSGKYSRLSVESLKKSFKGYQDTHQGSSACTQNFAGKRQQDIEELITVMLEVLHETYRILLSQTDTPLLPVPPPNQWEAMVSYHREIHQSIIQDLFIFFFTKRFTCSNCHQSKYGVAEPKGVLIVTLPLEKTATLKKCLDNEFTKLDTTPNVEAYKTKENISAAKYQQWKKEGKPDGKDPEKKYKDPWKHDQTTKTVLLDLPPILIIQLKRFVNDPIKGTTRKNGIEVDFPFRGLDMRPYLTTEKPKDEQNKYTGSTHYDLYAVANQTGGLAGGHYIAYAKPSHDFQGIGWRRFADADVSDIDEDYIRENGLSSAYILFYRRKDPQTN